MSARSASRRAPRRRDRVREHVEAACGPPVAHAHRVAVAHSTSRSCSSRLIPSRTEAMLTPSSPPAPAASAAARRARSGRRGRRRRARGRPGRGGMCAGCGIVRNITGCAASRRRRSCGMSGRDRVPVFRNNLPPNWRIADGAQRARVEPKHIGLYAGAARASQDYNGQFSAGAPGRAVRRGARCRPVPLVASAACPCASSNRRTRSASSPSRSAARLAGSCWASWSAPGSTRSRRRSSPRTTPRRSTTSTSTTCRCSPPGTPRWRSARRSPTRTSSSTRSRRWARTGARRSRSPRACAARTRSTPAWRRSRRSRRCCRGCRADRCEELVAECLELYCWDRLGSGERVGGCRRARRRTSWRPTPGLGRRCASGRTRSRGAGAPRSSSVEPQSTSPEIR